MIGLEAYLDGVADGTAGIDRSRHYWFYGSFIYSKYIEGRNYANLIRAAKEAK